MSNILLSLSGVCSCLSEHMNGVSGDPCLDCDIMFWQLFVHLSQEPTLLWIRSVSISELSCFCITSCHWITATETAERSTEAISEENHITAGERETSGQTAPEGWQEGVRHFRLHWYKCTHYAMLTFTIAVTQSQPSCLAQCLYCADVVPSAWYMAKVISV